MACKALSKVRIGVIGLGMRGSEAVSRLLQVEGTEIVALCHLLQEQSRIGRYCYSVNFCFLIVLYSSFANMKGETQSTGRPILLRMILASDGAGLKCNDSSSSSFIKIMSPAL